ncbi:MAG: hypothetical protein CMK07_08910 [Ponticaulis sp.]|nr:hypothetical protein [Ponticaulis sp.]
MSQMDKKKKFNPAETPIVLGEPQNYARAMISEVLRNLGYQRVFPATNAAEIVEAMNVWHPHVVIMENLLPDMQGTQLVHQFRREDIVPNRGCPVIMVTSDPRLETVKNARMAGVDEFAAKPISHSIIKVRLDEVLMRPRPFIVGKNYVGPCRRRKRNIDYKGSLKRLSDPVDMVTEKPDLTMNHKMLVQCAERLSDIAKSIDPKDRGSVRTLYNCANEASDIAKRIQDDALELATSCVTRYIEGVGASGALQSDVVTAHMNAIRTLLKHSDKQSSDRLQIAMGLEKIIQRKLREAA